MGVKERIIQYIGYKNLSVSMFQYSIGVSNSYVQNISNSIGPLKLQKISAVYPDLNINWLKTGEGEMLNDNETTFKKQIEGNMIPILPTYAQAGRLTEIADGIQEYDCEKMVSPINDAEMAIAVTGDSMAPEYPNGSRVIIKKVNEKAFLEWGRAYVLDTCNGIVIKNVYPGEKEGYIKCVSINLSYPPFEIAFSDVNGFWRVLMCVSMK